MEEALHVLVVDAVRRTALVAELASRWLLPVVICDERLRAESHIARWTKEHGIACDVLGQWLGRVSDTPVSLDWLVAVRAAHAAPPPRGLRWLPLDALDPERALLDYQGWAIARAVRKGELPAVRGPFGTLCWLDDVLAWVAARRCDQGPFAVTFHRCTAFEVVLCVESSGRRTYFKGMTAERAVEGRATQALSETEPRFFARTLALEARADGSIWWLTAECPGRPLTRPVPSGDGTRAVRALARIQQRACASASAIRALPVLDLAAAMAWCVERLDGDQVRGDAIARAFEAAGTPSVPLAWTPLDLDPSNILVEEGGGSARVSFIDLEDSYVGPAPLALAVFARRCRDRSFYPLYERTWSPPLEGLDWRSFETVAAAVEAWLGWSRVLLRVSRGELDGAWNPVLETRLLPKIRT